MTDALNGQRMSAGAGFKMVYAGVLWSWLLGSCFGPSRWPVGAFSGRLAAQRLACCSRVRGQRFVCRGVHEDTEGCDETPALAVVFDGPGTGSRRLLPSWGVARRSCCRRMVRKPARRQGICRQRVARRRTLALPLTRGRSANPATSCPRNVACSRSSDIPGHEQAWRKLLPVLGVQSHVGRST